jgi:alpha-L-fucosidase
MKRQPQINPKWKTIGQSVAVFMAAVCLTLHWSNISGAQPAGVKLARPTPEQAAWQDLELGLFIHYDMPVFKPGWDHRQYEKRPEPSLFNPRKLNTDQWLEAAKAMGAKYAVLVAKHGSGFMCWQSDLYPYGMKQSPYKNGQGDIVRDFVNSCRKYGIRPGIYAHMGCNGYLEVDNPGLVNRGKGGDPDKQARYARICEGMLTELWGNYGALSEIWFDGGVLDPGKGGPDMLPILHRLQPKAIVFQGPAASIRWIGNEDGVAPYPCWATVPEVRDYNGPGTADGSKWLPGECDVPLRQGVWLWEPGTEGRLFSVDQLMDRYYRSVGHNCNLLLNANPDPDGLIPEPDMKRHQEFGDEIRRRFGQSVAETNGTGEAVELALTQPTRIDHVITMENILEGERVREYAVEGFVGDRWQELCRGTAIGHKKIDQFNPTEVTKIRWRCLKSVAEPRIRRLSVYSVRSRDNAGQIDQATLDAWSTPYRGWHYYADPIIPSDFKMTGYEKFHSFDVPTVYQLPGQPGKWFMSFIGFDGQGYNSFVVESTNLVHWTNPRLAMGFGPTNEFDHGGCVIGAFLYESYEIKAPRQLKRRDGKYWTLYGCYPRQGGYELRPGYEGVAVSDDGLAWSRARNVPILSVQDADCASWEKDCIYQPWLVEWGDRFYNFYNAANGGTEQMGGATSINLLDWKRYPANPIVRVRPGGYDQQFCSDGKVFRDGDHWVMVYFGVGKGGAHIMAAFSRDLQQWTSHPEPLYKAGGHPGGLDSQYAHKISLVYNPDQDTFYLYYCAVGNQGRCIGLLTSKKLAMNPKSP